MYYLIDFENVRSEGLDGCSLIDKDDTIVLFYNNNCKLNLPNETLKFLKEECNVEFFRLINGGKNALDFYIATYIGELLTKNPNEKIAIISKDNGFCAVCDFCSQHFKKTIIKDNSIESVLSRTYEDISIDNFKKQKEAFDKTKKQTESLQNDDLVKDFLNLKDLSKEDLDKIDKMNLGISSELKKYIKKEILENKIKEKRNQMSIKLKGIKTFTKDELDYIEKLYENNIPFNTYNSLIHKFGKSLGHTIYHQLKN